ncbi:hypothetical protein SAURM35S_03926 [Streptomyces aurantiogriseus]
MWGLDRLRGRGRILHDTAPGPDLGQARTHPRHPGAGQIPPPDIGRRPDRYRPGEKSRLIYRPRSHLLLKGARRSFSWKDYRDLLVRAHIQLAGPIVVVWDNLTTHLAAGLKQYEAEHDWLVTFRLPPYAPDLNPVEAVWSLVRRAMANTAFDTPDDLDRSLRRQLRGSNSGPT